MANDNAVDDCASDVSDQQSVVGFSSLIDGQPTDPNAPTLGLALSGTRGTDSVQSSVQLAPGSERGWCDAVLFAQLPALLIDDGASLSMTAGVGWEQRWQEDTATTPTLATLLTASVDFGGLSTVVTVEATAIVAKTFGPVVAYLNGSLATQLGQGGSNTVLASLVVGAKWPPRGDSAFVADIVFTGDAPAVAEISYQFNGPFDVSVGPGVSMTFDGPQTIAAGVVLQREF